MRRSRSLAVLLVATVALAACSSDKRSIIDSGDTTATTAAATTTAAPVTTTTAGPAQDTTAGSSAAGAVTTPAPTTTAQSDISALPDCAASALDSDAAPVEIDVWHGLNAGSNQTAFEQLVAAYNGGQTKVHVNAILQGGYEDVISKYLQSGKGDLPDVVQMPEYMTQTMIDVKQSIPAEACIRAGNFDTAPFLPGALLAYSVGGVQWGMPFNVSDPVLFYNKAMFTAAGLDPDKPPASLDEVREDSQKIVDAGAATYGLAVDSGFDSGGGWYIEQWFAQLGEFYANNDNGRSARATQVLYDNDTGVSLLTQVQQLIDDGLAVSVGDNTSGYDNLLKLGDDKEPAAMTIATSASLGPVLDILAGGQFPKIGPDDVGVGPMPGPEGAKGAIVGGASMWITDTGDDAKEAAAWDFLQYLTTAQSQSTFSAATGYIAARDDARSLDPLKTTLANDPRFAVALDQLNLIADAPTSAGPVLGPLREVRTVTAQAVAQIFDGSDAKSLLDAAAQQSNALIADYNARN